MANDDCRIKESYRFNEGSNEGAHCHFRDSEFKLLFSDFRIPTSEFNYSVICNFATNIPTHFKS